MSIRFIARMCGFALAALWLAAAGPALAQTRSLPESFAPLAERLKPAVVQVVTQRSRGSGFIIDPSGYIVTNEHVIRGAARISVQLADERVFEVAVRGRDTLTDLALMKIDGVSRLPFVRFGDSDAMQDGDWVIAIGSPLGFSGSVTAGILSARERKLREAGPFDELFQTDAAINPGNSGGPLFNIRGRVIGVNTYNVDRAGQRNLQGLGFARSSSIVRLVSDQLRRYGETRRGWLGIRPEELTPALARSVGLSPPRGVLVGRVTTGSPAARAGIRRLDVILTFNGVAVTSVRQFQRIVSEVEAGMQVTLGLWRRDEGNLTVRATLARLSADASDPATEGRPVPASVPDEPLDPLALTVAAADDGVTVETVVMGGPAWGLLVPGDVILEADGKAAENPQALRQALDAAGHAAPVPLLIRRFGAEKVVAVELR